MVHVDTHDDVTRFHLTTPRSRLAGYGVSAYLVRGVLIDTGFPGARRDVERILDERRPRAVVLTHHHEDHAGNVAAVAERGIPVAAAPATLEVVRAGEPGVGMYRRIVWGTLGPFGGPIAALDADALAAHGLALVATPGHSDDHHAVWDAERETLFAGDMFLGVKVRIARPGERPHLLSRSARQAAALRPRRLFDAHRGLIPDPVAALTAKADWLDETIAAVERRLAEGWSDRAIAREVLGREGGEFWVSAGDLSRGNFVRAVREASAPR